MSVSFLRRATKLSGTLSTARRTVSQCRAYSVATTQPRHDHEDQEFPVPGPSESHTPKSPTDPHNQSEPSFSETEDPTEPFSRVEKYLASINSSGIEPTLTDLEKHRPGHCPPTASPGYVHEYHKKVNELLFAFTKEQLRKFLALALGTGRHCAKNRKKTDYAESILEQMWSWPTLDSVEKAKRDRTEVVTKTLPVAAHELFLILGTDGTDLLSLSKEYNVHISLTRKPVLSLIVKGTRLGVREFFEYVGPLTKTFTDEMFDLPSAVPIPEDMIQRISRLSHAYLENVKHSPGKLRIHAKHVQAAQAAKRLASRLIVEIGHSSIIPLLTYLPPGTVSHAAESLYPHVYALYPYLAPRSLPIIMNTSGAFRLRRVGDFFASLGGAPVHEPGLASGKGSYLTESESPIRLEDALLQTLPDGLEPSRIVIKASLGHVLLTRVSNQQRATLVPPLAGEHPFGKIRRWIASHPVKMSFVSDLPLPLLDTTPANQKIIHRLVYHSLAPSSDGPNPPDPPATSTLAHPKQVLSVELALSKPADNEPRNDLSEFEAPTADDIDRFDEAKPEIGESEPEPKVPFLSSRCWTGVQTDVNVMMPGRPLDLQLSACSSVNLSEPQWPIELKKYAEDIHAFLNNSSSQTEQPTPPLIVEYAGHQYILHSNASVKQSEETVTDSAAALREDQKAQEDDVTRALCESALDLETNQKSVHCEVFCEDISSEKSWRRFLTDCDRLSSMTYRSPNDMDLSTEII